MKGSLTMCK